MGRINHTSLPLKWTYLSVNTVTARELSRRGERDIAQVYTSNKTISDAIQIIQDLKWYVVEREWGGLA